MSAEEQAPERQLTLAEFEEMFADFLNGAVSLAQLRQCLVDVIDSDPDALPAVQEQIDAAMYAGRLPEQTWENLVAEIDHLVSENTPTEWSEDTTITPESDEAPLLEPSDEGPVLFDEEIVEPPVLVESVESSPTPKPAVVKPQAPAESVAQTETTHPMPDTTELPPGTVLEDRYVLVSRTEHGSMGTVYKALDRQQKEAGADDPWVAIKLITAEFGKHTAAVDTLRNEAEIGCSLNHPNIARSLALHEDGEHLFISMEWLDGESLSQLLDRKRPHTLPRDQALSIIEGLANGLAHAHAQGIVHADIKPANVFMTQTGEVKLLDFGIARASDAMPLTGGLVARTPAYASCEVLEGDNPSFQDDLFSLAAVAYRVLTGQRPFGSATALEAENEDREPVPVPGLSPQQWRALSSALAWRREQRSADVQSFVTEFFGEEEIVLSSPEPVPASPPPPAAEPPRVESQAGPAAVDGPITEPAVDAVPAPTLDTDDAIATSTDPFGDDEKTGAGWLRPALAAGILGVAVAAGWAMFGGVETRAPSTAANRLEVAGAPSEADRGDVVAAAEVSTQEATTSEPSTRETPASAAQASISSGPAGEELMMFMPGSGIPMASDQADEEPGQDTGATESGETGAELAAAAEAGGKANQPVVAAAAVTDPEPVSERRPATREQDPAPAARSEERVARVAGSVADDNGGSTPDVAAAALATTAAVTTSTAAAAGEAPAATRSATDRPKPADRSVDEAAPEQARAAESATQRAAVSETTTPGGEAEAVEADTVSAPVEATLASTMSMAMVSPDATRREAEPEQDTVPLPEPVKAPEPDAYGPPPELAPPRIEKVLMSTLKFNRFVEPKFPRRARDKGLTGWVDLRFLVTAEGETADIEVLDAQPGGAFDEAAVAAVERWRFKPRRVDGEAVPSRTQIRLRFE